MKSKQIIEEAEKYFSIHLTQTTENEIPKLICWKEENLILNANDYKSYFQSPVLYLQAGEKKIPTSRALQNELYSDFLAVSPLAGFGNGYSRLMQAEDHLLLFFALLESPTGNLDNEGNFFRDHKVTGAISIIKVDEGLLWGFWPDDNLYSNYDAYIKKICTIVGCPIYIKDDLKKGTVNFVHEEPDCNWRKAPNF